MKLPTNFVLFFFDGISILLSRDTTEMSLFTWFDIILFQNQNKKGNEFHNTEKSNFFTDWL